MAVPRLVYDDDCGFCMYMVQWLLRFGTFDPVGFSELTPDQKARLPEEYENCMHLLTDEAVYSCGHALEASVSRCGPLGRAIVRVGRLLPYSERIRERGYRFVADRRAIWGRYRSCEHVHGKSPGSEAE
ncbi:thiol-disulfide oxidoreductase DCC family protein [Halorubrum vacuolatum]|uniref:Predicted thiol-disulfide oxidoreductase YuxK, DCC family n=1 Tax=Halorubrum vacuolatum TaxID=63740 RepID=A0A238W9Y5_HALVU|nr:DCC1-like thiol-disulfide oxidoreductase family protein [Halorubrum vacuolatum]SNR43362.1 Predicted thiol-disulfide oxidoreductase YuxK, DCC family [Halorubrum vacuolatum]